MQLFQKKILKYGSSVLIGWSVSVTQLTSSYGVVVLNLRECLPTKYLTLVMHDLNKTQY